MKKSKAPRAPRVNKLQAKLDGLNAAVRTYVTAINSRNSVEHSRTPVAGVENGKKLPTSILTSELTSIVKTANKLGKLVVLGTNGEDLVVLLEDKFPPMPYGLTFMYQ